jgi:hypothetical protein
VDSDGIWDKMKKQYDGYFQKYTIPQNSVTLNDLLDLPQIHRFKKAFIKMDVEGHEHRVLLGAREFFKRIDVHGILYISENIRHIVSSSYPKYHQNPREQTHNHLLYYNESHVFRDYPILCYE